ncbi:hypothetical protein [Agrococcus sp. ProA11]|uniref:hypothetical protein n=1 Tax=Agrococcus chionoecetis TaxID=3153752 RepID=UPI00325FE05A
MTPTPQGTTDEANASSFEREMIAAGQEPAVATELERRIRVVERDERDDDSRLPLTVRELALYVSVTVAAVAVGILVVIL